MNEATEAERIQDDPFHPDWQMPSQVEDALSDTELAAKDDMPTTAKTDTTASTKKATNDQLKKLRALIGGVKHEFSDTPNPQTSNSNRSRQRRKYKLTLEDLSTFECDGSDLQMILINQQGMLKTSQKETLYIRLRSANKATVVINNEEVDLTTGDWNERLAQMDDLLMQLYQRWLRLFFNQTNMAEEQQDIPEAHDELNQSTEELVKKTSNVPAFYSDDSDSGSDSDASELSELDKEKKRLREEYPGAGSLDQLSEIHEKRNEAMKSAEMQAYLQGIPPEQLAAVNYYGGQGYGAMNLVLRSGKKSSDTRLATSGLNNLPPVKGTVYRGIQAFSFAKCKRFRYLNIGQTITEKAFLSTTLNTRYWSKKFGDGGTGL
ncbi:MAG: hypothetical protein AAF959_23280, partial [Cyanobacteria bacterium P01_D01_bin.56]